ncbi:MAG: GxxExxY protein [bacterium]|nr:GxxExxY protein [bacterium]
MTVHGILGNGFQEAIYQRALEIEFNLNAVGHEREKTMEIFYKKHKVGGRRVDFFVENKIMVELKAVTILEDVHKAQAINYLEAYNVEVGLLINFGQTSLQFKRLHNKKFSQQQY